MFDKKGGVLHWTLFGFLAVLGIVFYISPIDLEVKEKGNWQLSFLEDNYLVAEKDLLKLNIAARENGLVVVKQLAENGGYFGIESQCGNFGSVPLWNNVEESCFPDIKNNAAKVAKDRLKKEFGREFTDVGFKGNLFFGKGGQKTVTSKIGSYTYDYAFMTDLGYSFDEYDSLEEQSRELIILCNSENDLNSCLSNIPSNWYIGSCGESITVSDKKVPFCVESGEVKYRFALDFASS